jgi:DNA-binding MarR family transcriptional regulator
MKANLDSIPVWMSLSSVRVVSALRTGPASMTDIALECGLSSAAITGHADRLSQHGVVVRISNDRDRRSTMLDLTGKGQRIAEEIFAA